jgi:hypothetical protein
VVISAKAGIDEQWGHNNSPGTRSPGAQPLWAVPVIAGVTGSTFVIVFAVFAAASKARQDKMEPGGTRIVDRRGSDFGVWVGSPQLIFQTGGTSRGRIIGA